MKKYLPRLVFVVVLLLTISFVFSSCQKENFSKYYINGMEAFSAKKYDEALLNFNRAIVLEPDFAQSYYLRAHTHFNMENYKEAIADYTKCIDYDPNHTEAYYWRGEAYYDLEDYGNAISNYSEAIKLDSDNTYYYYSRGTTYYLRDINDDFSKSIDDYRKGCELGHNRSCKALKGLLDLRR